MNQKIKRFFCCFLAAVQIAASPAITAWAKPDWPSDTGIVAEAGIVMDADSGAVLVGQNIHVPYPPASITKLLTALIVLEHCQLDETVTYSDTAMRSVEADSGNKLSLETGDQMTVEDALYALLLISVNQSANALAEHTAGSIADFVDLMNEKLVELGCTESHFDNPSGLNGDTQYVSAYDMALIAKAAFENETLLKISSSLTYSIGPTTNYPDGQSFRNEHRLLYTTDTTSPYYYPPAVAGKTGYLIKAGNTLVTYAEQDGRRLISVILKGTPRQYFVDAKTLLEFGFARFQNVEIAPQETRHIGSDQTVTVGDHTYRTSDIYIEPGRFVTLPNSAEFSDAELSVSGELPDGAPADAVALLTYTYNERKIGEAYLMTVNHPVLVDEESEAPAENPGTDAPKEPIRVPAAAWIIGAVLLLVALAAGIIFWINDRRRKEAEALARRRERRRQRLQADGDEEEFNRLLAERLKKNQE